MMKANRKGRAGTFAMQHKPRGHAKASVLTEAEPTWIRDSQVRKIAEFQALKANCLRLEHELAVMAQSHDTSAEFLARRDRKALKLYDKSNRLAVLAGIIATGYKLKD